ncbi:hypothetical protein D3C80_1610520 [compost metagenome]
MIIITLPVLGWKRWKNSLDVGAPILRTLILLTQHLQHSPKFAQDGDFLKNYELMIETGRERSMGRTLQTFAPPSLTTLSSSKQHARLQSV